MADIGESKHTNGEKTLLDIYFDDLKKIPILSRKEEEKCARRARQGDQQAKNMLIRANLRFVVQVAKRYQNCGLPLIDLISEGTIGLMNAVERYDVDKGYHFISYAVWWVQQAILKAISQKTRLIRLPLNRVGEITKIKKLIKEQNEEGKAADLGEVAEVMGRDVKTIENLIRISHNHLSLDAKIGGDHDSARLVDFIEDSAYKDPESEALDRSLSDEIGKALGTLQEREAEVIRDRYGLEGRKPLSLKEIGARYKVSKERIRQIESRALKKLRDPARSARFRNYVDRG
jgi:RNA polymerase primary sigma factor